MGNPLEGILLFWNSRVPWYYKLLYFVVIGVYLIWPVDFILDIPPFGLIDDIGFYTLATSVFAGMTKRFAQPLE